MRILDTAQQPLSVYNVAYYSQESHKFNFDDLFSIRPQRWANLMYYSRPDESERKMAEVKDVALEAASSTDTSEHVVF